MSPQSKYWGDVSPLSHRRPCVTAMFIMSAGVDSEACRLDAGFDVQLEAGCRVDVSVDCIGRVQFRRRHLDAIPIIISTVSILTITQSINHSFFHGHLGPHSRNFSLRS